MLLNKGYIYTLLTKHSHQAHLHSQVTQSTLIQRRTSQRGRHQEGNEDPTNPTAPVGGAEPPTWEAVGTVGAPSGNPAKEGPTGTSALALFVDFVNFNVSASRPGPSTPEDTTHRSTETAPGASLPPEGAPGATDRIRPPEGGGGGAHATAAPAVDPPRLMGGPLSEERARASRLRWGWSDVATGEGPLEPQEDRSTFGAAATTSDERPPDEGATPHEGPAGSSLPPTHDGAASTDVPVSMAATSEAR
ncbi:collagen alpha-2(I) chain-like [Procambarus clarkii]|uniref:collagen alpha-2(I) chain-like n=1 Tax=Procambarus clarkii TaxID=6728 RepID=UPI001E677693|nr:collagen alpha-2(I) chain-like [Procambarus clarkii]